MASADVWLGEGQYCDEENDGRFARARKVVAVMELLAASSPGLKVGIGAAVGTASTMLGAAGIFVAQLEGSAAGGTIETLVPAGALTITASALVWVVKQIVAGNLVHRDPADQTRILADNVKALQKLTEVAHEREKRLLDLTDRLLAERLQQRVRDQREG